MYPYLQSLRAFDVVNDHLILKFRSNVSEPQLKTIVHTAFELLLSQDETVIKVWKESNVLSDNQKMKLITAVNTVLISPESPWKPVKRQDSKTQGIFFDLLRGNPLSVSELMEQRDFLAAIVWKKDPQLLGEAKGLLQTIFLDMYADLLENELTPQQSFHQEVIIGDLLSLYPFLRPVDGSQLDVPVLVDGKWQLASYQVEKIELTPKWLGSPTTAYGLNTKNKDHPPLLLFKGTTYPTDKGFLLSLLVDINPFASVGSYVFQVGKKKINEWLKAQTGNKKALIFGKSLGGSQAWRTALYFPDYVETVMAYGAPGLSSRDKRKLDKILQKPGHPKIHAFYQENDPVPYFDSSVPNGIKYYLVTTENPQSGLLAHASMYSTQSTSTIILNHTFHTSSKWKRLGLSALRVAVSLIVFPVFLSFYLIYNLLNQSRKQLQKLAVKCL